MHGYTSMLKYRILLFNVGNILFAYKHTIYGENRLIYANITQQAWIPRYMQVANSSYTIVI